MNPESTASSSHILSQSALKYWKLFGIGIQNTFVYRWNFLLRTVFGIVPLVGTVFLWQAIFHSKKAPINGYEYSSMIFYFMLTVFLDNLITPTEDEWQIAAEIRDGRISAFLIKPLNYLAYRVSLYLSYRLLYISVVLIPILFLGWIFRENIQFPKQSITWVAFAGSTLLAACLQFLIAYSLAMIAFWVLEISTIVFILYSFEYFLSGHKRPRLPHKPPFQNPLPHIGPAHVRLARHPFNPKAGVLIQNLQFRGICRRLRCEFRHRGRFTGNCEGRD